MTTSGGREIVKYMIKCAYPAGQTLTKQDQYGTSYTFHGSIGIAPELATGPCDLDCQEKISACMLAHVNNSGQHISIWMVGPDPGIGWGTSALYPYQEGAYFGNIFAAPWQGYYCAGNDMASGEVPGRLGSPLASNVYVDKYGAGGLCKQPAACTVTNERLHQLQRSRARGAVRGWPQVDPRDHRVAQLRGHADVQDLQRLQR